MAQKILAIIPARGGSKGIPKKNIQPLAGKPLIAHSILQAKATPSVTRVVVSTDDMEISDVSREYGAEIILRPDDISGDTATSESALIHVLDHLKETENYNPDLLVFLQCTSPLTLSKDIECTIQALISNHADSAVAVAPFHYFIWGYNAAGDVIAINHDKYVRPRRQDRDPQYVETGAVYVVRPEGFKVANHRFFGKIALYHMPIERRLEIDDPVDIEIAEVLMQKQWRSDSIQW